MNDFCWNNFCPIFIRAVQKSERLRVNKEVFEEVLRHGLNPDLELARLFIDCDSLGVMELVLDLEGELEVMPEYAHLVSDVSFLEQRGSPLPSSVRQAYSILCYQAGIEPNYSPS